MSSIVAGSGPDRFRHRTSYNTRLRLEWAAFPILVGFALATQGMERQTLPERQRAAWARLQPVGHLSGTNRLKVAIGLPWRNRVELTRFLQQSYDPASPQYRHHLTAAEFTDRFGPTEADYQAAIGFAQTHGLRVTGTHKNRMLLDVQGTAADMENAFRTNLRVYQHPKESRTFYAPDSEPSVELGVPVLHVSGLNDYIVPHPMNLRATPVRSSPGGIPRAGSGPGGSFMGNDFRSAYVPDTPLTGAGQAVGLFELNGYFASDIADYENQTGLAAVPLQNILIDGFDGSAGHRRPGSPNEEVALDIEMVISMAPGLSQVLVYEGSPDANTATVDDVLNRMATDNLASQLSCSWGFDVDVISQQIFQQFAAQGQSFYLASGDTGASVGAVDQASDDPYITVVGGTDLTTDGAKGWQSETTWIGSTGGISTVYPIPVWQQGISMSANAGSTTLRNLPDVAMVADNVSAVADNGQTIQLAGTSIAAPLWAGFTALVNEQAAANHQPAVGFVNPALYAIGKGSLYSSSFHDITTGNNTHAGSPDLFHAVRGYDLCTGWGTPRAHLITALLAPPQDRLVITPPLGFTAEGPTGGPFQIASETYVLTNSGPATVAWALANDATWLEITPTSGTLRPGDPATEVTMGLAASASQFPLGSYVAHVWFTNLNTGSIQSREISLLVGNGGFENGDFSEWTFVGDANNTFVDSIDAAVLFGSSSLPGVDDSLFTHSGIYGAFLGESSSLGSLSKTLPTIPGQQYLIRFWLDNPAVGIPNQFRATWNGSVIFDKSNLGRLAWTNLQFVVPAVGASSVLSFGFRNDQEAFGLDDITVQPLPSPVLGSVTLANNGITLIWTAVAGLRYQVQYAADLNSLNWADLGTPVTAVADSASASFGTTPESQRFYRVAVVK